MSIEVSDNEYSIIDILNITINPINDPPSLSMIDDLIMNEDETFTYSLLAEDIDGDNLIFTAEAEDNASVELNNNLLTLISISRS